MADQIADLREQYAHAIRTRVRIRFGDTVLRLARQGRPIKMTMEEAEAAADAVLAVRDAARQAAKQPAATERTLCSIPNPCEDGELCGRHEEEQAHAEGDHSMCGPTCETQSPRCEGTGKPAEQSTADRLDLSRRALDRAHALAEQWQGDQTPIARAQAAELLMEVLQLNGWTQTAMAPERRLNAVPSTEGKEIR